MNYYYCQSSDSGVCKIGSVVWTIPILFSESGGGSAIEVPLSVDK